MSGLLYNELQDVDITITDKDGVTYLLATEHYAFVIPCKECRYYEYDVLHYCRRDWNGEPATIYVEPDGFCAWGEKELK